MKITETQYNDALLAMIDGFSASDGVNAAQRLMDALSSTLAVLGIEIERATDPVEHWTWVERTWADVRQGDIIRPPGQTDETHTAIVAQIGPVNRWHASPNANQYWPNESPMEWSARRVTLTPLQSELAIAAGHEARKPDFTPEHGMRPDAAVEIKVTNEELAAIEACGGWSARVAVLESDE